MKTNLFTRLFEFFTNKKRKKDVIIIFVGDLVLETLQNKYREWIEKCDMLYIHTDMSQVQMYEKYESLICLYVGDSTENNCGKRDFESGKPYATNHKELIFSQINKHKYRKIILISTLRFSSACGVSTELYAELFQQNYKTYFIGIKPFLFEGVNSLSNYDKATTELSKYNLEQIVLIDSNNDSNRLSFPTSITDKIAELVDYQL